MPLIMYIFCQDNVQLVSDRKSRGFHKRQHGFSHPAAGGTTVTDFLIELLIG